MAKILLIEPNKILAKQYSSALSKAGHEVEVKPEAQAAIISADKARPDVIIMELLLARHGGVEFLYELRSYGEWQDIPVVILSRIDSNDVLDNRLAKTLNVTNILYKPEASLSKVVSTVDKLLA